MSKNSQGQGSLAKRFSIQSISCDLALRTVPIDRTSLVSLPAMLPAHQADSDPPIAQQSSIRTSVGLSPLHSAQFTTCQLLI